MAPSFKAPVGTHDVMPPESRRWEALLVTFAGLADRAGYGLLVSPTLEDLGLFQRVGESTDVVRKEMYDFEDRGGRRVALRPEGTAPVMRAYLQHRPQVIPFKAWYAAPSFRYERPQAGRYRQHHQLGVEVIGSDDPDIDVEVIALAWRLYEVIGLKRVLPLLNSLGDRNCRPAYLERLSAYLRERRSALCDEHRDRIDENPLRVLDCKRKSCREATVDAPRIIDHLCDECRVHFERVQIGLGKLGVPYAIETRLVRGLDYYTRTTFEFQASALEAAQNGIGGGGRYDGLAEELGGPPTPGIGFGLGLERTLLACDAEGAFPAPPSAVDVWVVDTTDGSEALAVTHDLRAAGIGADRAFDGKSMKSQMKAADRSGAQLAVIVGPQEQEDGTATVRDLRGERGQEVVRRGDLVAHVRKILEEGGG
jgi:histidyl-tRNA synthetase